jgi:hypothetical protein
MIQTEFFFLADYCTPFVSKGMELAATWERSIRGIFKLVTFQKIFGNKNILTYDAEEIS